MERRCALITGASGGIGRAVALELAANGFDIAVHYFSNEAKAKAVSEEVEALGASALMYQGDLATHGAVEGLIAAALERFDRLDVLVNNAGITRDALMVRMGEDAFDEVIDLNLRGAFLCMKLAAQKMMRARYGRIINMASVAGLMANPGQVNYSAAKAGLIAMTRTAARELGPRGITVNAICPGVIDTDMTKAVPEAALESLTDRIALGRVGKADEVAKLAAFLASDDAAYITGQAIVIDGGLSI